MQNAELNSKEIRTDTIRPFQILKFKWQMNDRILLPFYSESFNKRVIARSPALAGRRGNLVRLLHPAGRDSQ